MSHELTTHKDGAVEFAYRAADGMPWHGLGQEVPDGATIETWRTMAGMDWRILRSKVRYAISRDGERTLEMPEQHVLFRNDTFAPLGVVSDKYKVVQPGEVLEFFRDIVKEGGLQLSAAGTIYGGKRFWATAKIGEASPASIRDTIGGYLLLSTSADGSIATEVRRTSVRVVCRNTLALASREAATMRISHRSVFDPTTIKRFMGLNEAAWDLFLHNIETLANTDLKLDVAEALTVKIIGGEEAKVRDSKGFQTVMQLFTKTGLGAKEDGVYGTAWGLTNAFTEYVDWHTRARSEENRFAAAQWGAGADLKQRALDTLLALAD